MKICIDAGHYGKYNRSPVVKEYYESEMNWKLHHLLKKYLEQYGIEVIQTRNDHAKDLALASRGKKAKGCALLLSLHSNAASDENVDYVVAMYQVDDNCGEMDEQSKAVAKKLADCVAKVMGAEAKTWSTQSGKDLDGNGYKDDYYGVLRGAHSVGVAGVILEHGFHTNKAQAEWLLKDSNLDKLARAEAEVIAEHFGMKKVAEKKPSEKKSVDQIAQEVIAGKWGNGEDRKKKLTAAGYNAQEVQDKVNAILSGKKPAKKTIAQLADEVIAGKWGVGQKRKKRLMAEGYDYNAVQKEVNRRLLGK